jgi:hypothetical protein
METNMNLRGIYPARFAKKLYRVRANCAFRLTANGSYSKSSSKIHEIFIERLRES